MALGSVRMLGHSMVWRGNPHGRLPHGVGEGVKKLRGWMSLRGSLQGEFYFYLAKFQMSAGNARGEVRKAVG